MKLKNTTVRLLALFLASLTLLILLTACTFNGNVPEPPKETSGPPDGSAETTGEEEAPLPSLWKDAIYTEDKSFGEGSKIFEIEVIADSFSVTFTVKTDEEYLGTPLLTNGIITGDEGAYGLYITAVNGIVADYSVNQSWWCISKNGTSLMTGIDSTKIENGAHYELTYKIG